MFSGESQQFFGFSRMVGDYVYIHVGCCMLYKKNNKKIELVSIIKIKI